MRELFIRFTVYAFRELVNPRVNIFLFPFVFRVGYEV